PAQALSARACMRAWSTHERTHAYPVWRGESPSHLTRSTAVRALTLRQVLGLASSFILAGASARRVWTQTLARVVVVGGGFGGATCAKYLRRAEPKIEVTLIEPQRQFVTCPFSNAVLAGLQDLASITYNYD